MSSTGTWYVFRGANRHLQRSAIYRLNRALRTGELRRRPCEICGATRKSPNSNRPVEAHHEDYAEPLNVIWLCRAHHASRHRGLTFEEMHESQKRDWERRATKYRRVA